MELFRTVVNWTGSPEKIGYDSPILMLGSCFAENIGNILKTNKFDITLNPFGVVYHPIPAAQNLDRIIAGKPYAENELLFHSELWCSFDHHGHFSHTDINACLRKINVELTRGRQQLAEAEWLFITFGTAWGYRLKDGRVVANCHKYPASEFTRFRSDINQICDIWSDTIRKIKTFNPAIKIVFSVSPIRHLRDGAHENQLSKSTLLLAVERLNHETATGYFPAYEIMLDELRDYRFYNDDMTHPNSLAIKYIWQCFRGIYMTEDTCRIMKLVEEIVTASCHRPLHHTSGCRAFSSAYLEKIARLQERMPQLDFTREIEIFENIRQLSN